MAEPTKFMATHTVQPGETLSHLSLKYYGSTDRSKWMMIYEANKGMIGDNPAVLKAGWVLKIPVEKQEPAAEPKAEPKATQPPSKAGRPQHLEQ